VWAFSTQIIIAGSILPLKMHLPWYIHPFWLPFALVCGPIVSWLIQRKENDYIVARKILIKTPFALCLIGICLFIFSFLIKLNIINFEKGYFSAIFSISLAWFFGGLLLSNSRKNIRKFGFIGLILGSTFGLFFFVNSEFWLWEINENWDVRPVAEFIAKLPDRQIYIKNSFERPSLNWYAQKRIKTYDEKDQKLCNVIKETNNWEIYSCVD